MGEPVYLHFKATNISTTSVNILAADPYSFCAGYQVKVSDGSPTPVNPNDGCSQRPAAGSCASSSSLLGPSETKTEDILLNGRHGLEKPGTYEISATRELPYGTAEEVLRFSGPKFKITSHLKIEIKSSDEATLRRVLQPYVDNLTSEDDYYNSEAHRAIRSVAPLFLEERILGMLNSESSREFAVSTLGKMNTPSSREALADVASKNGELQEEAVRYLGKMGDSTYFPLLLDIVSRSEPSSNLKQTAIRAAAQLGHDQCAPFLLTLLSSSDRWDRINAVQGMYESGSRQVVPQLFELLRDKDDFIARMAAGVLVTLTHRTAVSSGPYEKNPLAQYQLCLQWWSSHAGTAPIFGPNDCGEIESLEQTR